MTKKLIEVALPLEAINKASAREKSIRHGHPSTLHLWWSRKPTATARAVIFAQMVDDPSAHPDIFKTEEAQEEERQRLFRIIEDLVKWENTTNETVLQAARDEIWASWRRTCAENADHPRAKELFDPNKLPAFHDPFAGGGALPLEAQRLGLESYASDLNPVAVLINKAMIEIPPRFAGLPPVNPESRKQEIGNRGSDALQGTHRLAESDGSGTGGLSPGADAPEGGDLWDALADDTGGGLSAVEHRRGMGAGVGQGEGTVPGDRAGLTGGAGHATQPLRTDRLVHGEGDGPLAQHDGRGRQDSDHHAQEPALKTASPTSYLLFPTSYRGAEGLAADVRHYGQWMRDEAEKRIGHLYPKVGAWYEPRSRRYFGEDEVRRWKEIENRKQEIGNRKQEIGNRKEEIENSDDASELADTARSCGHDSISYFLSSISCKKEIENSEDAIELAETARSCGYDSISYFLSSISYKKLTVIAWLWARTVKSPNPAFARVDVPLASTFMLSTKAGKEAYVEPVIENRKQEIGNRKQEVESRKQGVGSSGDCATSYFLPPTSYYRFTVKVGKPKDAEAAKRGTKLSRGANFECLMSGTPIAPQYIKDEGKAGRMGARLMAVVAEGDRGRVYLAPTQEHEAAALKAKPEWKPETPLPADMRSHWTPPYGLTTYGDLFTPRQLVALTTFSDLAQEARERVQRDALAAGLPADPKPLRDGGTGATAYAEAVGVYLACGISRAADYWNAIATWEPGGGFVAHAFRRQAIPMVWGFAESSPFSDSGGNWAATCMEWVERVIEAFVPGNDGHASQEDAQSQVVTVDKLVSTDPPYYDNIGYADLSDFFYAWLRRSLRPIFPDLFATLAVPKAEELVATPYRHGSKEKAETFFLDGMTQAMHRLAEQAHPAFPVTIYYAFKQSESDDDEGTASTGWDTFLAAVIEAGFAISGTWPMRTERGARSSGIGTNALASSIVLVCRPRPASAPTATRREFVAALKAELPVALAHLQRGNIAPVDLAQAAIGPGMAVYTRFRQVLDAEGKPLTVREALALINQTLDEALAEQEGDFDADSRWALTWFEQSGFAEGEYGVAEQLSKAKNTSVAGMVEAGILESRRGKVRLLKPEELPADWDPATDPRLTAWEIVHHLIRVLGCGGEGAAAALVAKLGAKAEIARELAYRLYTLCERKKRAAEALAYNGLVQSWPEIARLAREGSQPRAEQGGLFGGGDL